MKFNLTEAGTLLERTPVLLFELLHDLPEEWIMSNEGPDTFSPFDVVGHLIHGEKTDWVVRTKWILEKGTAVPFEPYDRFAQARESEGKSLKQLLEEFRMLREQNLEWIRSQHWKEEDFEKRGLHPVLGEVSLRNLLSTWVVHDLTHLAQITRVMAKQYKGELGPWPAFFRILNF
jgi:DinB superfamily